MIQLKSVAIVGVGLIGGSIGLALQHRKIAERVIGIGRDRCRLKTAYEVGAVTETATWDEELACGLAGAELVVVCTPVDSVPEHVRQAARHATPGTLITDSGSTKRTIAEALDGPLPNDCRFVGSHPLAGSEKSGVLHAEPYLLSGRVVIITPTPNTAPSDADRVAAFWQALGAKVLRMTAAEHDRAAALTSHLPHALAVALAAGLPDQMRDLAGSGFRDTTRVAAGDPEMWRQIFIDNRENVLDSIGLFRGLLDRLAAAIGEGHELELKDLLTLAKKNRDALGS